ncbi:hypothetical protein WH52_14360 [Tenacibaculum holothuriorum]|uniref:Bacterial Pleckstrin homology domain-containing protein n=2 Tax=Tenacibaculum holothuriorum TaxID=1635173 RepID=A0A1Y2P9K9_9FLAO|nr:hypothetical protein WH52_14360 [Tenacibaculum holothuriorum]
MYGNSQSKVKISDNKVIIFGMYGLELPISNIENIQLSDTIPEIITKTNGFNSGNVKKGYFDLKYFGESHLLINSGNPPYLIISAKNAKKVILNLENAKETKRLFNEIKKQLSL